MIQQYKQTRNRFSTTRRVVNEENNMVEREYMLENYPKNTIICGKLSTERKEEGVNAKDFWVLGKSKLGQILVQLIWKKMRIRYTESS